MGTESKQRWPVTFTAEAERWYAELSSRDTERVELMIEKLKIGGPTKGRPDVDHVKGARNHKMKELRSPGESLRVLFAFDSTSTAIMLVGGDKRGKWNRWYRPAVRRADQLLDDHERTLRTEERWRAHGRGAGRASEPRSR